MPSTLVHAAFAGLLGTALLGRYFDARGILVVMGATAVIDLDAILGIWFPGTHRAAFHTLLLPAALGALLAFDVLVREESFVVRRWGAYGVRVGWVTLVAVLVAGSLYDAFFNGVDLFWPIHDRFYDLSGQLLVSDQRGAVQTFVELGARGSTVRGTTATTHYYTGVDPTRGAESASVERVFHVVTSGDRLVLLLAGYASVAYRLVEERSGSD